MSGDSKRCEHDHAAGAGCSGHDHGSCACSTALAEVVEPAPLTTGARRIAMPVAGGTLCAHFGHSEQFAVFDVDDAGTRGPELLVPPPHEPGVLPVWLRQQRVTTVIAGGMGARAQSLLVQHGIQVVVGAPAGEPAQILSAFLSGTLETGTNTCDH